jgi:hypothetical protein
MTATFRCPRCQAPVAEEQVVCSFCVREVARETGGLIPRSLLLERLAELEARPEERTTRSDVEMPLGAA